MTAAKKILVLGAGLYYTRVIRTLVGAGFHVIAVDRDRDAAGAAFASEFHPIDIVDIPALLALARDRQIDGVMPVNDFGTRAAAAIAHALALVGLRPETAELANDKGRMRDRWRAHGLPMPDYRVIGSFAELVSAIAAIGLPCVLKPTDCGGSGRGISVIREAGELDWAFRFATPFVTNGRYIVESFIDGLELTVETISIRGRVHVLAMSDKVKPDLRTRVATSLNYPADVPEAVAARVVDVVSRAVLALGLDDGMGHTEVICRGEDVQLVEIGARGGGAHVFHTLIEASSGIDAPVLFARLLTGEAVEVGPVLRRGAVYRFFTAPPGILREVRGLEQAAALPGVLDLGVTRKPGDRVGTLENSLHRPGFVVTSGPTRADAIALADRVESMVSFIVDGEHAP